VSDDYKTSTAYFSGEQVREYWENCARNNGNDGFWEMLVTKMADQIRLRHKLDAILEERVRTENSK
jgi:hypothetical protein